MLRSSVTVSRHLRPIKHFLLVLLPTARPEAATPGFVPLSALASKAAKLPDFLSARATLSITIPKAQGVHRCPTRSFAVLLQRTTYDQPMQSSADHYTSTCFIRRCRLGDEHRARRPPRTDPLLR